MISQLKSAIKSQIQENLKIIILLIILFFAGAAIASLQNFQTTEEEIKLYIKDFFYNITSSGTDFSSTFNASLLGHIKSCVIILFASLTIIGAPVLLLFTVFCGFSYGTVLACLLKSLGTKSILIILTAVLPHIFVSLPAYMFFAVFALKHSVKLTTSKQSLKSSVLKPILLAVAVLFILSASSLIQGYIEPLLIRLIALRF